MNVKNSQKLTIYDVNFSNLKLKRKRSGASKTGFEIIKKFKLGNFSNNIQINEDSTFILCSGGYPPCVKVYDLSKLKLGFQVQLAADALQVQVLGADALKFAILQNDWRVLFYNKRKIVSNIKLRTAGRSMTFRHSSAEVLLAGDSPDVYRFDFQHAKCLSSYQTNARSINRIETRPYDDTFVLGTEEGQIEVWDPRVGECIRKLYCAENTMFRDIPSVTSLYVKDTMSLAAGTSDGKVFIFDIRQNSPSIIKKHTNGQPIKNINYVSEDLILSTDKKFIKFWKKQSGEIITSVESQIVLNELSVVENTGLMMMGNDTKNILAYYIPFMGPPPRWCADKLGELEE